MIPANEIKPWSNIVPWITDEQIEQNMVICRSLVEIFSNEFLAENLVFRGGLRLRNDYYIVITPEHRSKGGLFSSLYIAELMKFLVNDYYVNLLNAGTNYVSRSCIPDLSYKIAEAYEFMKNQFVDKNKHDIK
jgi:hypothetical protein